MNTNIGHPGTPPWPSVAQDLEPVGINVAGTWSAQPSTNGPDGKPSYWYVVQGDGMFDPAIVSTWPGVDDPEAVCRLMAESREMLAILPELLEHSVSYYGHPKDENYGVGLLHARARAAIARATTPSSAEQTEAIGPGMTPDQLATHP